MLTQEIALDEPRRNRQKLKVVDSKACVYHYGFVRHPLIMAKKHRAMHSVHHPEDSTDQQQPEDVAFDYYPLDHLPVFDGTHPRVMHTRIENKDWDAADYRGSGHPKQHKHNRLSQRVLSFVENKILGGRRLWDNKNYIETA